MNEIEGFIQLVPGKYKSNRPIIITGVDKIHLKCDCIIGSIVKGIREANLHSFALSLPQGENVFIEPKIKLFQKIIKPVLSPVTFYLEDNYHKPVYIN